jgi:hypothetical protein
MWDTSFTVTSQITTFCKIDNNGDGGDDYDDDNDNKMMMTIIMTRVVMSI